MRDDEGHSRGLAWAICGGILVQSVGNCGPAVGGWHGGFFPPLVVPWGEGIAVFPDEIADGMVLGGSRIWVLDSAEHPRVAIFSAGSSLRGDQE